MYQPSARAVLAHTLIERGAFAEAARTLELSDPEPWVRTIPYALLLEARARIHAAVGDPEAAARDLAAAGELLTAIGSEHPFCPWRSRLGVLRARSGDLVGGRELVELDLRQARAADVARPLGIALHSRGLLDRLEGRDGLADLEDAVAVLDGVGARTDQARAHVQLGVALAETGDREQARATLHAAGGLARRIGATDLAESADLHLRRVGGRPLTRPDGLTESELRVARLAARGLTNARIAAELVVTTHTVRFHLGRVYRKLHVSGRGELGAALDRADRGDRPPREV